MGAVKTKPKHNMTIYTEVQIKPASSGFGLYERGELQASAENSYAFRDDLIQAVSNSGIDFLPLDQALRCEDFQAAGIADIRGLVQNQPRYIFARLENDSVSYLGIEETEVDADFFTR